MYMYQYAQFVGQMEFLVNKNKTEVFQLYQDLFSEMQTRHFMNDSIVIHYSIV